MSRMDAVFSFYYYFCRILIYKKPMKTEEKVAGELAAASKAGAVRQVIVDIVLFTVLTFVLLFLFTIPFMLVFPQLASEGSGRNIYFLMLNEGVMLAGVLFAAWLVLTIRHRPLSSLGLSLQGCWKSLLKGAVFVAGLKLVGFGVSLLSGVIEVADVAFSPVSLLLSLLFFFLVAITEELMVRGFILGRMLDGGINKFAALFMSSVSFSLLHVLNPDFAFVPFLNIVLAGFFLGASYVYTRNLCFPIALHWFWNWIQGPVLGYKVSGNELGGESLLTLRLPEENLINGGAFGFEGSLLCSGLLVLGTALIIGYYNRHASDKLGR